MFLHRAIRWLMIGSFAAAAAAWWMKDLLPDPQHLQLDVLEEPVQTRVRKPLIDTRVNGVDYRIQPRYAYELNGIVVSLHHSDSWWDYAHQEWGDNVNVMDLCVVWGDSVRSGAYRDVSFHNSQWECNWSYSSERAMKQFDNAQASNNHIVTDDPAVAKALRGIHVGDQIRLKGYLVDYTAYKDGRQAGTRVSSETRTDSGPGACEVLYVDGVEQLGSANRRWRQAWWTALGLLLFSLVAWMFLPVKFGD